MTIVLRLCMGAVKYAINAAASDAVLGLDIHHVQENIPVAEPLRRQAGKAQVVEFEQIERGDDVKQPPGMADK